MMIDTFTVDSGVIQIGPGRNLVNIDDRSWPLRISRIQSSAGKVGWLNLEGDRQADLTVHGSVDKASLRLSVREHYPYWVEKCSSPRSIGTNLDVLLLGMFLTVYYMADFCDRWNDSDRATLSFARHARAFECNSNSERLH